MDRAWGFGMIAPRQSVNARRELARADWAMRAAHTVSLLCIGGLAVLSLLPLALMLFGSLTAQRDFLGLSRLELPARFTLDNYVHLFRGRFPVWQWLLNSIIVSGASAVGVCVFGLPAGYALAKGSFRGRAPLVGLIVVSLAVPMYLGLVPLFQLVRQLGLANTLAGMILPFLAVPTATLYFRQSMLSVPDEMLDAARIDGASEMVLLWHVVWPHARPAALALGLLTFMARWRDYVWQSVVAADQAHYTLTVGLARLVSFADSTDLGLAMAGGVVAFVPLLIAFLLTQEGIVRGLAGMNRE